MMKAVIKQKLWNHEWLAVAGKRYGQAFGDSFAQRQAKRTRYALT